MATQLETVANINEGLDCVLFQHKKTGVFFRVQYLVNDMIECLWVDAHGHVVWRSHYDDTAAFQAWCSRETDWFEADGPIAALTWADTGMRVITWREQFYENALSEAGLGSRH